MVPPAPCFRHCMPCRGATRLPALRRLTSPVGATVQPLSLAGSGVLAAGAHVSSHFSALHPGWCPSGTLHLCSPAGFAHVGWVNPWSMLVCWPWERGAGAASGFVHACASLFSLDAPSLSCVQMKPLLASQSRVSLLCVVAVGALSGTARFPSPCLAAPPALGLLVIQLRPGRAVGLC